MWRNFNKRGGIADISLDSVVYLLLLVIFFAGMLTILSQQKNGAAIWEDYYAKEIAKVIDFSIVGDSVCFDVHKATEIAKKNSVKSFSEIFTIDNVENDACVKLSAGRKTCFNYFNDVDVVNINLKFGLGENEKNRLCFDIARARK